MAKTQVQPTSTAKSRHAISAALGVHGCDDHPEPSISCPAARKGRSRGVWVVPSLNLLSLSISCLTHQLSDVPDGSRALAGGCAASCNSQLYLQCLKDVCGAGCDPVKMSPPECEPREGCVDTIHAAANAHFSCSRDCDGDTCELDFSRRRLESLPEDVGFLSCAKKILVVYARKPLVCLSPRI